MPTGAVKFSRAHQGRLGFVNRIPRRRRLEFFVYVIDVLDAFGFEPLAECRRALLPVDRDAFLPGRASAEYSVELHARLTRQFQRLAEFCVADARRKIDER